MIKFRLSFLLIIFCIKAESNNLIKKIEFHINFIEKIYKKYKNLEIDSSSFMNQLLSHDFNFQNEYICQAVNIMKQNNQIEPLIDLTVSKRIYNSEFINELKNLILIIYKNFIMNILPSSIKDLELNHHHFFTKLFLNNLPQDNLLDSLDILYLQIKCFTKLDNNGLDWQNYFLNKLPTLICTGVLVFYKSFFFQ